MTKNSVLIVLDQVDDLQSSVDQIVEMFNSPNNRLIFVFVKGAFKSIDKSFDIELESLYASAGIRHEEHTEKEVSISEEIEAEIEIRTITKAQIPFWLNQTKFVDVLVVSNEVYGANKKDVLRITDRNVEASVLVLSKNGSFFQNIVLVFDTANDSISSIKMFCKLFPSWCNSKSISLLLLDSEEKLDQNSQKQIVRYLNHQCNNLGLHSYQGEDTKHLKSALEYQESTLIAYGSKSEDVVFELFNEPQSNIDNHVQILMH